MTTVLYADVLFLINFSMDFISVYIAAQLLSLRRSALRFSLASLIGALGATAMTALSVAALPQTVLTLVLSVVMTATAYGGARSLGQFLFRTLTLWGGGALLGGCVTAVCSIGERRRRHRALYGKRLRVAPRRACGQRDFPVRFRRSRAEA